MNNFPLLLEYGGERPTGVEVSPATAGPSSRTPQRDDPPRSKFLGNGETAKRRNGEHGNRVIVLKEGGMFVLRTFVDGEEQEVVKVPSAQMILDYVRATWSVGTKVQWIIIPRRPRTISSSPLVRRSLGEGGWLKRIPVGAHL